MDRIKERIQERFKAGNMKAWEKEIIEKAGDDKKAIDEIARRIEGGMTRAKTTLAGMSEKVLFAKRRLPAKVRRCAHSIMRQRGISKADKAGTSSAIAICTDRWNKGKLKNDQLVHLFACGSCDYSADDPDGQIHMTDNGFECPNCGKELDIIEFDGKMDQMKMDTVNMTDVEIVDMGTWKGIEFDGARYDRIIKNFKEGVIEPYITIDHDTGTTEAMKKILKAVSLGFVSDLKKTGTKLVATFKQVPKKVAELIQAGALKKRSIEFWRKYKHADGKVYSDVLEAVTFHGANGAPAIHTLSDVVNLYKNELQSIEHDEEDAGSKETINFNEGGTSMDKVTIEKAEYDALKKFKADHPAEDLQKMKDDVATKDKKIADLEKFKADREKADKETLKADADAWAKKQVEDQKLLPKFKDMKSAEYQRLAVDTSDDGKKAFELFKEEVEKRDKIANFGDFKDGDKGSGGGKVDMKDVDTTDDDNWEKLEEAIQTRMKSKGETYNQAAVAVGAMSAEEAGIEKKEGGK